MSSLELSSTLMADFITTLSVVEWTENGSNPETCDASTFNSEIAYFTRISSASTEVQKKYTIKSQKMGECSWRISNGKVLKGEDRGVAV